MSEPIALALAAAGGYLLGALPFGVVVARLIGGADPRLAGSRRTGATNVLRTQGAPAGVAVLILDAGKGAGAAGLGIWLAALAGGDGLAGWAPPLAALAAVVGHVWSVFLRFAGGRGVATSAGGLAVLGPAILLAVAVVVVGVIWRTRYVSLGSLTGAALAPLVAAIGVALELYRFELLVFTAAAGSIVVVAHRDNLARLRAGTERRFGERERR